MRFQMRDRGAADVKHAVNVNIHRILPLCIRSFFGGGVANNTGAINHDIEPIERCYALGNQPTTLPALGNIGRNKINTPCCSTQTSLNRFGSTLISAANDYVCARFDEGDGSRFTHARGSPRNQNFFPIKIEFDRGLAHYYPN